MKVSILQTKPQLGKPSLNQKNIFEKFEQAMKDSPDLVLLPELWNIGFFPSPIEDYAEEIHGESISLLQRLAKKHHVNIVGGSIATRENGHIYNTCPVIDRDGRLIHLTKKLHLFTPGKEDLVFSAGDEISTFPLDGHTCACAICYDLRFPELIRKLALSKLELLLLPMEWPKKRLTHLRTLLMARAIENQIFVAAANGSGDLNGFLLGGHSMLLNPWGEILAEADEKESILSAELDFSVLTRIKEHFNVLNDRRTDLYQLQ